MVMVALGTMNALSSLKDKEWFKPLKTSIQALFSDRHFGSSESDL